MSRAVMQNPLEQVAKYGLPTRQGAARNEPTPAQTRRLRKKMRRLTKLVAEGRLTVEVEEPLKGATFRLDPIVDEVTL